MLKGLFKKGYCKEICFEGLTEDCEEKKFYLKSFSRVDIENDRLHIELDCLDLEFDDFIHMSYKQYPNVIHQTCMTDELKKILIDLTYCFIDETTQKEKTIMFQLSCNRLVKSGLKQAKIINGNFDTIQYEFETYGIDTVFVKED